MMARARVALVSIGLLVLSGAGVAAAAPAPVTWTTAQDHADMMRQLGLASIRPGPSGDPSAPNAANTDESKANPFPDWPDLFTDNAGRAVSTELDWRTRRRPEIVEAFSREVLGRVPANLPKVTWQVTAEEVEFIAFRPVRAQRMVGHVENPKCPGLSVDIRVMVLTPVSAPSPVPALIMLARADFPSPRQPSPEELARINDAARAEMIARDPSLAEVFARYPAWQPYTATPFPPPPGFGPDQRIVDMIAAGWAVTLLDPASVQADNGAGLTRGIIGLGNCGQPRKPDDWGALRAWAWGAGQVFDVLAGRSDIDSHRIGIEGVSRYGKAALVTMAFDERFASGLIGSSGEGGASPYRRNFGEAVENLAGEGEYHWMAGNFLKYAGPMTADDLPVDSHMLIALAAPRALYISYGIPEAGDALWLDPKGSYMAAVAASPVWGLYGVTGLSDASGLIVGDYRRASPPLPETDILAGQLGWRQHVGGHTDAPNMTSYARWASGRPR